MVQVAHQSSRSVVAIARSGNFRAIAHWLNTFLQPHNLFARVSPLRSGCLQVLIEFYPSVQADPRSVGFRSNLVQFVCHHLWKLNSEVIDGVQVACRPIGQQAILWRQSVRIVAPARKARLARSTSRPSNRSRQSVKVNPAPRTAIVPALTSSTKSTLESVTVRDPQQLRRQIWQATQQKAEFKALRSFFLTGSTAAAFIIGCWIGYADAPAEQTSAVAFSQPSALIQRSDVLQTADGAIPVVQQPVANPSDPTATLMFGGDVALTESYTEQVGTDNQWTFAQMEEYRQADVAMVNLDAPFTRVTTATPDRKDPLKANPDLVQVLKHGGVDLVNLANSRTMDYTVAGLEETLTTLQQAGIHAIGAGRDAQAARRPEVLEVKGQRIAYFGYDHLDANIATLGVAGTNFSRQEQVAADIKAVRNQVDWVIVNYHWGNEIAKYPGDTQVDLARFTIDQGADLVVGYHAQTLQGAELYKGRPIVYSLGNFVFGSKTASDYDTAVLKVALNDKQMKVELLPVEVRKYQPKIVRGDRGTQILKQIENVSDIFQQPMQPSVVLDTRTDTLTLPAPSVSPGDAATPSPSATPSTPSTPASGVPASQPSTPAGKGDVPWSDDSFISKPTSKHLSTPKENTPIEEAPSGDSALTGTDTVSPLTSIPNQTQSPQSVPAVQESGVSDQENSGAREGQPDTVSVDGATGLSVDQDNVLEPMPTAINESPSTMGEAAPAVEALSTPTEPAIAPLEILHPIQTLEPIKRRYAEVERPSLPKIAATLRLPGE